MIIGLKILMDRPVDRERPCCRNICMISAAKLPHAVALNCADCGQHRGWLSNRQARQLNTKNRKARKLDLRPHRSSG